ncbi:hypothetical protein Ddc_10339 [Ditylenchus destructor]|nr:hypothetical protein Ddc_10339 [Ditylenchus destructor]
MSKSIALLTVFHILLTCVPDSHCHIPIGNPLTMWSALVSWITGAVQCPNMPAKFYSPKECASADECIMEGVSYQCTNLGEKQYCCPPQSSF